MKGLSNLVLETRFLSKPQEEAVLLFLETHALRCRDGFVLRTVAEDVAGRWKTHGRQDTAARVETALFEKTAKWIDLLFLCFEMGEPDYAQQVLDRVVRGEVAVDYVNDISLRNKAVSLGASGRIREAAIAWETLALLESDKVEARCYWSRAAYLRQVAGDPAYSAALWKKIGRTAKSQRLSGTRMYDLREAATFLEEARRYIERAKQSVANRATEEIDLAATRQRADTQLRSDTMPALEGSCEWNFLGELFLLLGFYKDADVANYYYALGEFSTVLQRRGTWVGSAMMFFTTDRFNEFEGVCREADELEFAALSYERAGMPDDAQRIYAEMARDSLAAST